MTDLTYAPTLPPDGVDVTGKPDAVTYAARHPDCADCARGVCLAPSCTACDCHTVEARVTVRHTVGQCPRCRAWWRYETAYAPRFAPVNETSES